MFNYYPSGECYEKKLLSILCTASLLASGIQSTLAESIAVEGSSVFIVDNSIAGAQLIIKNLVDGTLNSCLANTSLNLDVDTEATDILIKNGIAVIATYNSPLNVTDATFVDVSSCITVQEIPVEECITTVDNGILTIPCVQYKGQIHSVILEQRGNSMNWELKSSPILNDTFKGYKGDADSE